MLAQGVSPGNEGPSPTASRSPLSLREGAGVRGARIEPTAYAVG